MNFTVLDVKNDLIGLGHGLSLSKVYNVFGSITRAKNQLISDVDFFELLQERQIANSIFDSIYDYPAPPGLVMDKIVDIFPQVNRQIYDKYGHKYVEDFDRKKSFKSDIFSVEYRNGVKVLRVSQKYTQPALQPTALGNFSSLTGNGTWVLGGDATGLVLDMVNYVAGTASLRFDLSGAGTTWYIENSGMDPYDLSTKTDGSLFDWVWLPEASEHTNLTLRWGSSVTDYYESTVTAQYFSAFVNGWNQMENIFVNATVVGSPDVTAITYVRIGGVYDGSVIEDMRVGGITALLGTKFLVKYYRDTFFQDATTGAYKDVVDDDSDIIVLEQSTYNGFLWKCAEFVAQQVQNQGGSIDMEYFITSYLTWKRNYSGSNKSQAVKPKSSYYKSFRGRGRFSYGSRYINPQYGE